MCYQQPSVDYRLCIPELKQCLAVYSTKKTILILTNSIGGLHSFRKEVVKAIVDAGYEVYISEPDDDERVRYFDEVGCHIIKTDFNRRGMNPFADFKLMLRYRKLMKQLKPKAVLTYTIKPNIYGGDGCSPVPCTPTGQYHRIGRCSGERGLDAETDRHAL